MPLEEALCNPPHHRPAAAARSPSLRQPTLNGTLCLSLQTVALLRDTAEPKKHRALLSGARST